MDHEGSKRIPFINKCSLFTHLVPRVLATMKVYCWWFKTFSYSIHLRCVVWWPISNETVDGSEIPQTHHYLQGFKRVRWCRISSINRIIYKNTNLYHQLCVVPWFLKHQQLWLWWQACGFSWVYQYIPDFHDAFWKVKINFPGPWEGMGEWIPIILGGSSQLVSG